MGLGTDAAIEAADVVLVSDRLSTLVDAIKISRRTMGIARFNILFALLTKAVVLLFGALGIAQMWMAVFADVGVTVLAVLNSARILSVKRKNNPTA
jgi:Cd2+/Zn2+-exporting ATPase